MRFRRRVEPAASIPAEFWSNEGGPWYYSPMFGIHDAAAHVGHPATVDYPELRVYGAKACYEIGEGV